MNRIDTKIVLGSKRFKSSIDKDLVMPIYLEGTQKESDEFDRSTVVSLADIFDEERQGSSIFRLTYNIDFLFFNAYYGVSLYDKFENQLSYFEPDNAFSNGGSPGTWSGYPQYKEFDLIRVDNNIPGYTINPNSHVDFRNINSTSYNWNFYISYPYKNDDKKQLRFYDVNNNPISWAAGNGIPFYVQRPYFFNGQNLVSLVCGVKHNFKVGDYAEITIGGRIFTEQIVSLGNEGFNSENYILNLYVSNLSPTNDPFATTSNGTLKKIIDINYSAESKSIYYVRKHRILTNYDDANLIKSGFQNNAFGVQRKYEFSSITPNKEARITERHNSQTYNLTFKKDIDISRYKDNLNRPISELYLTVINRGYFGWFNKPVLNKVAIKEGFDFNLTSNISPYWSDDNSSINLSDIQTEQYTRSSFTFFYNKHLKIDDELNGDFCEFNNYEQQEYVLSELYHKISFNNDVFEVDADDIKNPPGYYYKPHHKVQLRVYSDYIEEGDIDEVADFPDYSYYSKARQRLIWRDLYTYGFRDIDGRGVDHPFLNGAHYPTSKILFRLKPEGNVRDNIITISQPREDECE